MKDFREKFLTGFIWGFIFLVGGSLTVGVGIASVVGMVKFIQWLVAL